MEGAETASASTWKTTTNAASTDAGGEAAETASNLAAETASNLAVDAASTWTGEAVETCDCSGVRRGRMAHETEAAEPRLAHLSLYPLAVASILVLTGVKAAGFQPPVVARRRPVRRMAVGVHTQTPGR